VTKQTVQYHYKSFADKETVVSDKGAILLDRHVQALLSEKIGKKNIDKSTKESANKQLNSKELELLKEELNNKDEIITELLESQKNLQKLLDQQQVLPLQANQKIEQLEMNQVESGEKEKLSFRQRLFGK
jgi:hypothetical protein